MGVEFFEFALGCFGVAGDEEHREQRNDRDDRERLAEGPSPSLGRLPDKDEADNPSDHTDQCEQAVREPSARNVGKSSAP